ncbi:MAG: exosortase/archaeosortase family protein [Pirellulaceae bacterium]
MKKTVKRQHKLNGTAQLKAAPKPAPELVVPENPRTTKVLVLAALIVAVLVWSYGSAMWYLVERWWNEPDYTYGFLVPLFAGYLLWHRREMVQAIRYRGSWWGWVLIAIAAVMRWGSVYLFLKLPDPASLIPCLAGVVLVIGGWAALRWSWPALFFLGFMVPLPGQVAGILSHPLQRVGAIVSTAIIQTLGIPSVARGNIIVLPETELGIAEACNGLPMMMLFFAICVAAVFLSNRSWIEKLIILASAAPIAVLANVIRIAGTAKLYQVGGVELGNKFFHDLAGWFMMPLAVLLLWALLWMLDHALVIPQTEKPLFVKS